jgi:hypothetical protein
MTAAHKTGPVSIEKVIASLPGPFQQRDLAAANGSCAGMGVSASSWTGRPPSRSALVSCSSFPRAPGTGPSPSMPHTS